MYNLEHFRRQLRALYRRSLPYDDDRHPTQEDLAQAIGLNRAELNKRLHQKQGKRLTDDNVRAIVRVLAEWGAITSRAEALELLGLLDCPTFTAAEWQTPPLSELTASPAADSLPKPTRNNLPQPLTSFIGRNQEREQLAHRLAAERLVTILGTGGSGKTRLALEVAREQLTNFPDGVFFVPLAPLHDPTILTQKIAAAVGVKEQPGQFPLTSLLIALGKGRMLLVIDNCEHLVAAAAELVSELLQACPYLHILTTTRERLLVDGEAVFLLSPLALPPLDRRLSTAELAAYDAVELFVTRAQFVRPGFSLNEDNAASCLTICRALDGLPMAIELACSQLRVMNPQQLAVRLDHRFQLFKSSDRLAPPRHQSLDAMIAWSYDLLEPGERLVLGQLSVFASSFNLAAAEGVCDDEDIAAGGLLAPLTQLVDKSLVEVAASGGEEARYRLLETIREYAHQRLEQSGAAEAVKRRYVAYYLNLTESMQAMSPGWLRPDCLECFEQEHDNLRVALTLALESGAAEQALRMAAMLWRFWRDRGYLSIGLKFLTSALLASAELRSSTRIDALYGAGMLAIDQDELDKAEGFFREGLELAREISDRRGEACSISGLAGIAVQRGDYRRSRQLLEQNLTMLWEIDDKPDLARTLSNLGKVVFIQGDYATAQRYYEQSLNLYKQLGDKARIGSTIGSLGALADEQGDHALARTLFSESLTIARELGERRTMITALHGLGKIATLEGDYGSAYRFLKEGILIDKELNSKIRICMALEELAQLALAEAQMARVARLLGAAEALRQPTGAARTPSDQRLFEAAAEASRSQLGEQDFTRAWSEGMAMSVDEAVAYVSAEEQPSFVLQRVRHKNTHFQAPLRL